MIDAMLDIAETQPKQLKLAFIPTTSTIRDEDKRWLIDDLSSFSDLGFSKIDIVDIAALDRQQILHRLQQIDILVFGGGSTQYLLQCIHEKLGDSLIELLETRILLGISAGSVMCCPYIDPSKEKGLGYVDFMFIPHKDSPFTSRTKKDIQKFSSFIEMTTYWVDDNSGILVNDSNVTLVGSGNVEVFHP